MNNYISDVKSKRITLFEVAMIIIMIVYTIEKLKG